MEHGQMGVDYTHGGRVDASFEERWHLIGQVGSLLRCTLFFSTNEFSFCSRIRGAEPVFSLCV